MGASPFPYFDAREKVIAQQKAEAERAQQRAFTSQENEKQRDFERQKFLEDLGLRKEQLKVEQKRATSQAKQAEAYSTYMTGMIENQANQLKLRLGEAVSAGSLKKVTPDTQGAIEVGGSYFLPASPTEKTKQTIEAQKLLKEAEDADWQSRVTSAAKAGLIPEHLAGPVALMGKDLGRTLLATQMSELVSTPKSLQGVASKLVTDAMQGKLSTQDLVKNVKVLKDVATVVNAPVGSNLYNQYRMQRELMELKGQNAVNKINALVMQRANITPDSPKYPEVAQRIAVEALKKGEISREEFGYFATEFNNLFSGRKQQLYTLQQMLGLVIGQQLGNQIPGGLPGGMPSK